MKNQPMTKEVVVLLHRLARTTRSMSIMERFLSYHGYRTLNLSYPSTEESIENLAERIRLEVISKTSDAEKVHFVTHSMGGIIVRFIQKNAKLPHLGRVVMLSPPNKGSEIVDAFKRLWLFKVINGPAGGQLGTDSNSLSLM